MKTLERILDGFLKHLVKYSIALILGLLGIWITSFFTDNEFIVGMVYGISFWEGIVIAKKFTGW